MIDWLIYIKDVGEWSDTILLGVKPGIVEIVAQDLKGNSKGKTFELHLFDSSVHYQSKNVQLSVRHGLG